MMIVFLLVVRKLNRYPLLGGVLYRKNSSVTLIDTIQLISSAGISTFSKAAVHFMGEGRMVSLNSMGVATFEPIPAANCVNVNVTIGAKTVPIIREYYEENVWYIVI